MPARRGPGAVRLFLAGDVMLGRGIDQIQRHSCDPALFEGYIASARDYVRLAERACGPIPRKVPPEYVWGDLLDDLDAARCDARVINLETAVTTSDTPAPKGINYRMHPANVAVLSALRPDICVLANNHVLDWGRAGLLETLGALDRAGLGRVGAGETDDAAASPAAVALPGDARLLMLAFGAGSSGVPPDWAAGPLSPGVSCLPGSIADAVEETRRRVAPMRRPGDLLAVSLHWGGNWGYGVGPAERALAHALIEKAGADIVYGHSSHHPKAIEVHEGRPILYGCGDLINDYEGISGQEDYRADLALGYLLDLDEGDGTLLSLTMLPYRIRAFRLGRADSRETAWIEARMSRECGRFGGNVHRTKEGALRLDWA